RVLAQVHQHRAGTAAAGTGWAAAERLPPVAQAQRGEMIMSRKHLVFLAVVTAVIVIFALVIGRLNQPESTSVLGQRLYPGLEAHLNDVVKVVAQTGGREAATLVLKDGRWAVADRNEYPADTSKLRQDLLILAREDLVEPK